MSWYQTLEDADPTIADLIRRETARQWAGLIAQSELYGLPLEDPEWIAGRYRELDRAARRRRQPDRSVGAARQRGWASAGRKGAASRDREPGDGSAARGRRFDRPERFWHGVDGRQRLEHRHIEF